MQGQWKCTGQRSTLSQVERTMSTTITMKQQILDVMQHECAVINHLLTKVPEGDDGGEVLEYRPAAEQRTLLELQRYLTYCAIMPATYYPAICLLLMRHP